MGLVERVKAALRDAEQSVADSLAASTTEASGWSTINDYDFESVDRRELLTDVLKELQKRPA